MSFYTDISSEAAKLCKHRLGKPSHPRPTPTHPIAPQTVSRMKYYGIHWSLNSFIRRLKRDYIDLIAKIPRYARVGLLPRTAAGQPRLPPGHIDKIDIPT